MKSSSDDDLVIFTDADNTLWDTNNVFRAAQLDLLDQVENVLGGCVSLDEEERLSWVRTIDKRLASSHPDGFKYPVKLLVDHMAFRLVDEDKYMHLDQSLPSIEVASYIVQNESEWIQRRFFQKLSNPTKLLPTVLDGLNRFYNNGIKVIVVSEGREEKIHSELQDHNIKHLVERVIVGKKNVDLYEGLASTYAQDRLVMIGDQITRDVIPASNAGFVGILVPSQFDGDITGERTVPKAMLKVANFREAADRAIGLVKVVS